MIIHDPIPLESSQFPMTGTPVRGISGGFFTRHEGKELFVKYWGGGQADYTIERDIIFWAQLFDLPSYGIWLPGIYQINDGVAFDAIKGYQDAADRHVKMSDEQRDIITLFDLVIANVDRHSGNYGATPDGTIWLIDNGGCAAPTPPGKKRIPCWNNARRENLSPLAERFGLELTPGRL